MKRVKKFQPVPQKHSLGCAVSCVASLCKFTYPKALKFFDEQELAWTRGFYCSEIVNALAKAKLKYAFAEFSTAQHADKIKMPGTIVFTAPDEKYPAGHFFLRTEKGWMNPWSNFPTMIPVISTIEKSIAGRISYLLYPQYEID